MGTCYSCSVLKNKVRPTSPKSAGPKKVKDNFVRGRADGESDVSDNEKVAKPQELVIYPGPGHLQRHVLGSSFSSSTCSSQTISELCEDKEEDILAGMGDHGDIDPLTQFYQLTGSSRLNHEMLSRYDMLSEVASEVKTEGGLTDVAIDLDHPFAPSYQDGVLIESMLSRPRSVGLRGRSSYARDMMSQLSNYSDFESPRDIGLKREDTPIPGTRGKNSLNKQSKLAKKKSPRKKVNLAPKKRAYPQFDDHLRAIPSGLSDSTFSVRSDDGGSSLSSTSSLSAIGEMTEQSSAESKRRNKAVTSPSVAISKKQQPASKVTTKEKTSQYKGPKSAENIPNAKIVELSPIQTRSADLLSHRDSGGRQGNVVGTSYGTRPLSSAWGDQQLYEENMSTSLTVKGKRYSNHFVGQSFKLPPKTGFSSPCGRDIYSPVSPRNSLQLMSPSPRESDRSIPNRMSRPKSGKNYPTPAPRPSVSKRLASLVKEDLYSDEKMEVLPNLPVRAGPAINVSQYDSAAYCTSYCDVYGYYQPAKWCVSQDPTVEVYCCGSQHDRYCCADQAKDVGDSYPPVKDCPNSSWWHYQWKVIVGLLGTLVVMLMFAACCYYCCGGDTRLPSRSRFMRRRRGNTDQGTGSSPYGENNLSFNPESPNAFTPPDYDSLPKDPPKYADIFNADQGISNPACDPNETGTDSPQATDRAPSPPPTYTSEDNSTASNTDTNDTNLNNNPITETQPCDVILEVPAVTVSRSSSSHSLNEPQMTSDSHLLSQSRSQSNTRQETTGSDVEVPLVCEQQVRSEDTQSRVNTTAANDVTVAIVTGEALSVNTVGQAPGESHDSANQSDEVQHM